MVSGGEPATSASWATLSFGVERLAELLPVDLFEGREVVNDGLRYGHDLQCGHSTYLAERGVRSELAWRERARGSGTQITNVIVSAATWAEARESIELIFEDAASRGTMPPDRFVMIPQSHAGTAADPNPGAPSEVPQILLTQQDWWELTHTVPLQAEVADNLVGDSDSLDRVAAAIQAGVSYVGTSGQCAWRWTHQNDDVARLASFLTAAGVIAAKRADGVVLNSYLEKGFAGGFRDYASYVGWSMLERYVYEELIGAAYSCSWGGLTTDPLTKSALTLAIQEVGGTSVPAAFVEGGTIGLTEDVEASVAPVAVDLLYMKMVDYRYRLGGAQTATSFANAIRAPLWQDVASAHAVNRRMEQYVPIVAGSINWSVVEARRDAMVTAGRIFYERALAQLSAGGIDVADAAQVLLVLARLGPDNCERLFGVGEPDPGHLGGVRPVLETDRFRTSRDRAPSNLEQDLS